jgi:hypothetical protein
MKKYLALCHGVHFGCYFELRTGSKVLRRRWETIPVARRQGEAATLEEDSRVTGTSKRLSFYRREPVHDDGERLGIGFDGLQ